MPLSVDHLVYASPDLDLAVKHVENLFGIKTTPGGQHPGGGTRNTLLALGERSYFEIIGPDPDQPDPGQPRPFGIDDLKEPRLVTWAVGVGDLDGAIQKAKSHHIDPGEVLARSRRAPDGTLLAWRRTIESLHWHGIVPFLIDWGSTRHPSVTSAKGCRLIELRAEHPDPDQIQSILKILDVDLAVQKNATPALIAVISTPNGIVELR